MDIFYASSPTELFWFMSDNHYWTLTFLQPASQPTSDSRVSLALKRTHILTRHRGPLSDEATTAMLFVSSLLCPFPQGKGLIQLALCLCPWPPRRHLLRLTLISISHWNQSHKTVHRWVIGCLEHLLHFFSGLSSFSMRRGKTKHSAPA